MPINIRPIQPEDNEKIASIIREILTEHGMNKPGTVFTDPTTDTLFELFQTENAAYWVVEENNSILGGCGIYPTKGLPNDCAELVKLYLSKELRGKGLGKQLMQLCMEEAKSLGYNKLYLESMPELNSAVGLYEKLGYKKLDSPMGDSGHFACDLWMVKELV
jgi:putative acetyltransferase